MDPVTGLGMEGIDVRVVPVAEVMSLRARVLRAGRPLADAQLEGDDDPGTVVLAAYTGSQDGPVSTATLMDQPCPWRPGLPAVRLRAMATDGSVRGQGIGALVLAAAVGRARVSGADVLWCLARTGARSFYDRAGFTVDGGEFDVPGIGPHLRMDLDLRATPSPG